MEGAHAESVCHTLVILFLSIHHLLATHLYIRCATLHRDTTKSLSTISHQLFKLISDCKCWNGNGVILQGCSDAQMLCPWHTYTIEYRRDFSIG